MFVEDLKFTFQYGATSTANRNNATLCINAFTFQYGATSTFLLFDNALSNALIYIPIWSYFYELK